MKRLSWHRLLAMAALLIFVLGATPSSAQTRRQIETTQTVADRLLKQIHATTIIVQLQMSEDQAAALAGAAMDIGSKWAMLEANHEAQLAELLVRMQDVLRAYQTGDVEVAESEKDIVREKIEDLEEERQAGIEGLAEEAVDTYVILTPHQRALCFGEFFADRTTGLRLDELNRVPQTAREASIYEIAETLADQASAFDAAGNLIRPDENAIIAVLSEAAGLSYEDYRARREDLVARLVKLFPPQQEGVSLDALERFVEFLACPELPALLGVMQRVMPGER